MKSNNKIQYIVIILLILLILYLSVNNMEKFTVTPASSSEAIANIASMYNNSNLTATAIKTTGNIDSSGNINASGNIVSPVLVGGTLAIGSINAQGRITAGNDGEEKICIKNVCITKDQLAALTSPWFLKLISTDLRMILPGASFYKGMTTWGDPNARDSDKNVGPCGFSVPQGKYSFHPEQTGGFIWYMSVNPGYHVRVWKDFWSGGATSTVSNKGNLPLLINLYTMTIINKSNGSGEWLQGSELTDSYIQPRDVNCGDPRTVQVWLQ